jgi:ketosteroid isomerase-like protein
VSQKSTTPDLAELNRRLIDTWNRGDVKAAISLFARDAVWEATAPGAEHLRGLTAIHGHLEDNLSPYEEYQVRLEEFLDLGNGVSFSVTLHGAAWSAAAASFKCASAPSCSARAA